MDLGYSYGLAFNVSSAPVNAQDAPSLDLASAIMLNAYQVAGPQ
jgi:hypothetical protein